jgi:hypothetical protein
MGGNHDASAADNFRAEFRPAFLDGIPRAVFFEFLRDRSKAVMDISKLYNPFASPLTASFVHF